MQQLEEGARRTNRRTGEVQEFRGGQWVQVAPGTAPTAGPGIVQVAPPQPRQPPPQTPVQAAQDTEQLRALQLRNAELEREAERLRTDPAGSASVDQRRMGGFHLRAVRADEAYRNLGVGAPDLVGETVRDIAPRAGNYVTSDPRRRAIAAEEEFVAATLRYESGAAIPPEELEAQRRRYFPQPGDDEQTIRLKGELRHNAIEALQVGAGEAAQAGGAPAQTPPPGDGPHWEVDPETGEEVLRIGRDANQPAEVSPSLGRSLHMFGGDVAEAAGDVLGLVGNPLNAGINWAFGTNLSTDLGQEFRGLTGAPAPASDAERLASAVNRGGIGALTLAGSANALVPTLTGPGGAGPVVNALARFGAAPLTDTAAGASAGGSSEVTRQMGGGPVAQILAGLAGGAAAIPGANRVNALLDPAPPVSTPLVRAAEAENIAIPRAMVDSSRRTQQRLTAVDRTMAGGPIVQGRMDRVGSRIEERVSDLGRGGTPLEASNAGQTIRGAGERYIRSSGQQARRLYDAAETAAEGIRVQPRQSLAVVDEMIARLAETGNTNSAEITFLNGLRQDLQSNLSVGALRDLRTTLRKRISDGGLVFGQNEERVLNILETAGQDIEAGLRAQGRERAATLFRRADDMYADRMDFIRNGVQRLIGSRNRPATPEQVFAGFRSMASPRGDEANLARMIREMEPEEQADIAATFADALGRGPNGEFSVAQFIRQAGRLPPAARANIFGARGAESVDNLLTIARDYQRVRRAMGGSPTGVANDYRSWLTNAILGTGTGLLTQSGLTGLAAGVGLMTAKAGRDIVNARLLMSPNIQSWLRSAPRTANPQAIDEHFGRLRAIAAREPALAPDIDGLEQAIMRAANENFEQAVSASQSDEQERR